MADIDDIDMAISELRGEVTRAAEAAEMTSAHLGDLVDAIKESNAQQLAVLNHIRALLEGIHELID